MLIARINKDDAEARHTAVDVRSRALLAIADLANKRDWVEYQFLDPEHPKESTLEESTLMMLAVADPNDKVAKQAADTLKTLTGKTSTKLPCPARLGGNQLLCMLGGFCLTT